MQSLSSKSKEGNKIKFTLQLHKSTFQHIYINFVILDVTVMAFRRRVIQERYHSSVIVRKIAIQQERV